MRVEPSGTCGSDESVRPIDLDVRVSSGGG